jgi:hypothetical protein
MLSMIVRKRDRLPYIDYDASDALP